MTTVTRVVTGDDEMLEFLADTCACGVKSMLSTAKRASIALV
jgi:hypothetical protein